jgi:hypothetical protein
MERIYTDPGNQVTASCAPSMQSWTRRDRPDLLVTEWAVLMLCCPPSSALVFGHFVCCPV